MSDLLPSQSAPTTILRRAANLLSSTGQLTVTALAPDDGDLLPPKTISDGKLGASIKRKFREVRDASTSIVRSRSLTGNSSKSSYSQASHREALQNRNGHVRSYSDAYGTRPTIVQLNKASHSSPNDHETQSLATTVTESADQVVIEPPMASHPLPGDVMVPQLLQQGTQMIKVSAKKHKKAFFRLDPDQGQIVWESNQRKIIPIENIKELRSGSDARYYREQFQLAQEYEDRWLTIVYILEGNYKTMHLIAATTDVFQMWDTTLRQLHAIRQQLMSGLGNIEMRQAVWTKQYWKGTDQESDQLDFEDVERLCKRLNINSATETLLRLFKQADRHRRNYLDFADFQLFVKLLKGRPEIDRLYKKICSGNNGVFNFRTFEKFMQDSQKSVLSTEDLLCTFERYATNALSSSNLAQGDDSTSTTSPALASPIVPSSDAAIMTIDGFTSFLLSPDNSAFSDQNGKVSHDMTRPLSEYYVSSSHNTYLVGHQLVGDSTIEGYIRALLHGCRSVEVDIYDGDVEPMIFHGKTLTSKVSLREVCQAIKKYGFVASPYPIIISAEIHCGLAQQDMMVEIMIEVFGEALVRAPVQGRPRIRVLPSPEDLKGRILLKAKNLYVVSEREAVEADSSSTDTTTSSASDSDAIQEVKEEWRKVQARESETLQEFKPEISRARTVMEHVRNRGKSVMHYRNTSTPPLSRSPKSVGVHSPNPFSTMRSPDASSDRPKVKMSQALVSLLVYTVGVKCRGINKKEEYAPEHVFSLSENTANKMLKHNMIDLIKHNRTHVVRIYPKGLRLKSTNFEPHRYWSAGAQLVAINWQTFDLGYMINHAMFQRNGRSGYVLKPPALRMPDKDLLARRTRHFLRISIISAQQLPRPKDASGREIIDKFTVDPFVEVSIHVPDWAQGQLPPPPPLPDRAAYIPAPAMGATAARTVSYRTSVVKNNGFNPVWHETLRLPFDCVGDMRDLIFVRFAVKQGDGREDDDVLALYCASLGSLRYGYRHLPLHDAQLSQYLFSTLFVQIDVEDVA